MQNELINIAGLFQLEGELDSVDKLGDGFINDTFYVKTKGKDQDNYLLQRKNRNVFTDIPAMMQNIQIVSDHLKSEIIKRGGDPRRESMTIIPARDGNSCIRDEEGEYWAMCLFIDKSRSYDNVSNLKLAYEGGRGIGLFHAMLTDMKHPLTDILPGFHNIRFRFRQWDEALANDAAERKAELTEEIEWIEARRNEMMKFWQKIESGLIPTRVSHNDTKINNLLFDLDDKALCMIDLDTVLNSTVLNDFGDAIRTYANSGLEDDPDLENISLDIKIYEAYTKGYLKEASSFLTEPELDNLAFSAKYIIFEQVMRFLMDYINGDTYYKIKYPGHNLQRTHAQFKLLQSVEKQFEEMKELVKKWSLN